jgi:hypothetical protein
MLKRLLMPIFTPPDYFSSFTFVTILMKYVSCSLIFNPVKNWLRSHSYLASETMLFSSSSCNYQNHKSNSTGVFPDQLKCCCVHPLTKSSLWTKKFSQNIVPYLTYLFCINSLREFLNFVSLINCLTIIRSIFASVLTPNLFLQKLLFCMCMVSGGSRVFDVGGGARDRI